jgi:hypothetical protein
MSKTTDAIEQLNDAQKKAIKNLCNGKLESCTKAWFFTGAKCRKDTSEVLSEHGLVETGFVDNRPVVKATGMGRRVGKALMACLAVFVMFGSGCGDKIQTAKTVLAFVNIGVSTADAVFDTYAATQRTECLKKGIEGSPEFTACYKPTAELMAKWGIIEPKLVKATENAASYIKAAESGGSADYATAVKETVCLLAETMKIIPGEKWKAKIKMFLDLAGAYACTQPTASTPERDLYLLRQAHKLLTEMLGQQA